MNPKLGNGGSVVVTGVAGFIGSHLALRARQAWNASVTGIDNFDQYYASRLKRETARILREQNIAVLEGDLVSIDPSTLPADCEIVFHAAAQPGISATTSFETYLKNNVVATEHLLNWARTLRHLRLFVNLSTSSVYGLDARCGETTAPAPASYYGVTKLAAEQLCLASHRQTGLPTCSCRLFSVYGPRERPDKLVPKLLHAVFHGQPFPFFEGSETHVRSFTYIDDIVDGLMRVGSRGSELAGNIFNLGTDVACTTQDVVNGIESLTGKELRKRILPPRAGDQFATTAVIDKARTTIGYSPPTTLKEGLRKTIEWYQAELSRGSAWTDSF